MGIKQFFLQGGVLAGCLAFGVTLWRTMSTPGVDVLQASMRAILAGLAVIIFALILTGLVEWLGGPAKD